MAGCSSSETDQGEYSISGQVVNEEGEAVEDVSVNFKGVLSRGKNVNFGIVKTDADGRFSKRGLTGLVKITPVKGGYNFPAKYIDEEIDNLVFKEGEEDEAIDSTRGDLEVEIFATDTEEIIEGTDVKLSGAELEEGITKETDNSGQVVFEDLNHGTYKIAAVKNNYLQEEREVDFYSSWKEEKSS